MNKIDVSIVIVCMNNYGQLKDCLNSIQQYTTKCTYEVLLVAYFFSEENLTKLKTDFPWVKVIISNEIRGFSANNNLALRQAQGEYCFVLNDDTYMEMPVVDMMVNTLNNNPEIELVSPQILRPNRTIQYSGIPYISWIDYLMILFHLKREEHDPNGKYIKETGLFKTYNILGAAFVIRTQTFRDLGFLDERYYFGPEDKALGDLLNKKGYSCYVNADAKIVHLGGATGGTQTKTLLAARPANRKGCAILYSGGSSAKLFILETCIFLNSAFMSLVWLAKLLSGKNESYINSLYANLNVCSTIFKNISTTEIFKMYYKR